MTDQGAEELTPKAAEDLRFNEARLGVEAEKFLSTNMGKYLVGRADLELEEAHKKMETCPPEELQDLQNQAWRANQFITWLAEAIHNGRHAEFELKQNEELSDD